MPPGLKSGRADDVDPTVHAPLISLLARATELEHGMACACLFAACTLKNDAGEGGLSDAQADVVRGWKRRLLSVSEERMVHLAQLSSLLAALGATPHFTAPTFLLKPPTDTSPTWLALEPLSPASIDRLAMVNSTTFAELYSQIEASLARMPEGQSFAGRPTTEAKARPVNRGAQLVPVVDLVSAQAALKLVTGNSEVTAASDAGTASEVFATIRTEFAGLVAEAQQAGAPFDPARPVAANPTRRQRGEGTSQECAPVRPLATVTRRLRLPRTLRTGQYLVIVSGSWRHGPHSSA